MARVYWLPIRASLSVTAIARACVHADRGCWGFIFSIRPPVLPLVEIVPGLATGEQVVRDARALVDAWGKTTVLASDTPGFIVNRVARPFFTSSLIRIMEERIADRRQYRLGYAGVGWIQGWGRLS